MKDLTEKRRQRETGERDSTMANEKPLRKIAEAFKALEEAVNSQTAEIEVAQFSSACSLVSPLFGCLGIAFKFAEIDYVAKVRNFNFPFGSRENQRKELESKSETFPFELDRFLDGNRSMISRRRRSQSRPYPFWSTAISKGNAWENPAVIRGICWECSVGSTWLGYSSSKLYSTSTYFHLLFLCIIVGLFVC